MLLIERINSLLERAGKKMDPFKRKDTLDNGPRGGKLKKKEEWDCKCSNYVCMCDNGTRKKKVKIKREYKKKYNADYKAHRPARIWRSKVRSEKKPSES